MNFPRQGTALTLTIVVATLILSGCSSSRFGSSQSTMRAPEQLQPVASSQVQSQALPPLGGQDGSVMVANNGTFNGSASNDPNDPFYSSDPALIGQANTNSASGDGSFVSLDDVGSLPNTSGRDLSGTLTPTKLLGSWTVMAGADQCRLNLTQTTKTGTNRYRASTPGCTVPTLSSVASWQLTGSQIQLYDDSGAIVGSLLRSGNRFLGTMSGGVVVSMVG